MSEDQYQRNLAVIRHELVTPMRGHDADGACCREAIAAADVSNPAPAPLATNETREDT